MSVRRAMAWAHGWLGLIAGWLLFAMFLTGTASYFRPEITRWMQPELAARPVAAARAAQAAIDHMRAVAPDDEQWTLMLPDARSPVTMAYSYVPPRAGQPARFRPPEMLDPASGAPLRARATYGGETFYRFHFELQLPYPWGRWLAGLCAMAMFAAILSGVITHKRIFADFFTLRWRKGQRSWLDAHNVSAVLALPYHALITYTGLITLATLYMPWPIAANYRDPAAFAALLYGPEATAPRSGAQAPLVPVGPLIARAEALWQGGEIGQVAVRNPGDAGATITLRAATAGRFDAQGGAIVFSGTTGRLIAATPAPGPAARTAGTLLGLHIAGFAGPALRWALFALGLAGTTMVGTGLLLWTAKRVAPGPGRALVERLNIATVAALPASMAAYLLANRLLPAALAGRADLEVRVWLGSWAVLAAYACLRPARRAWREVLAAGAVIAGAVPVASALCTTRGLVPALRAGDWLFVSVDGLMIGFAALFALASRKVARSAARRPPRPRTTAAAAAKSLVHAD
ncbi:PepSY-associated TM helix domain-containing protein [Sphingomonas morindae]|uniref:PepSY domain-containing protein n=1 Tax=Sphingomonas morindae TaxID=1541170 RepID=A0ABY4X5D8_9SPHN|nr:PepSY-associated TM helix domain-containing protein [Sphingomonas morindae]USI72065.1 PepSY domain-containing protein [Sphingomonas morindae]